MSSCIKLQYRRKQLAGHVTHWIVKVPDADIYASCSFVGLGVVYQHSLKPIVEADEPVLAVVLLRALDVLGKDRVAAMLRVEKVPALILAQNAGEGMRGHGRVSCVEGARCCGSGQTSSTRTVAGRPQTS